MLPSKSTTTASKTTSTRRPGRASAARPPDGSELVKKIETSTAPISKKRRNTAQKKLKAAIKEYKRLAKSKGLRAVALTLTYRNAKAYSKKNISKFLDCVRSKLRRSGHSLLYAWVLESASHLHYHLILWLPRGYTLDLHDIARWWPLGSTWVETCKCVKAWAKYLAKTNSAGPIPRRARLFGSGGLDEDGKARVQRAALPRWLLRLIPRSVIPKRLAGGGWVDNSTGEIYLSPYLWTPWGMVYMPAVASPVPVAAPV